MEAIICISCGRNCTEEDTEHIMTEDGPVCIICIDAIGDPENNYPYDY